jgi:hypothetical protein
MPTNERWWAKIAQQQKAKMPAAGATQALRLFCNPLAKIFRRMKTKRKCRAQEKSKIIKEIFKANKLGAVWSQM